MSKLIALLLFVSPWSCLIAQEKPSAPVASNVPAVKASKTATAEAAGARAEDAVNVPAVKPSETASAQKARALLDKMIAALGGQTYLDCTSMEVQGRGYTFYQGKPNSYGTEFWYFWQSPDKDRMELGKKRDVVYVHSGSQGYEITFKGTSALADKDMQDYLRRREHSLETVLREWMKDPATLLFYAGPGVADDRMVEQVTLLNSKNQSVTIALDPGTYLPVRKSFTYRDPVDNLKSEETEIYGNYRLDQGIMTAHTIVRSRNGEMEVQRFLTKVQYNPQLNASLFEASVTTGVKSGAERPMPSDGPQ